MNRKGFTLVELLAVLVILAIILAIAVPNILGIIDNARRDAFIANARMMTNAARTKAASDPTILPATNSTVNLLMLNDLDLENIGRDPDGGTYGNNSYVYVAKDATGAIRYFVTLQGSRRAINLVEDVDLIDTVPGAPDTADAPVTTGTVTLDGEEYTVVE